MLYTALTYLAAAGLCMFAVATLIATAWVIYKALFGGDHP